eukprot:TRINITY_DN6513_c0_g1_i1.p1 TRINITY_DN6513_c0_g1~~TRINITY_DN6513_c0_g1_i1.p1  ORF type:complete len:199 (-),score=28.25 TRINITY_DN6513_c0_g1_i1:80-676(-)
MASQVPLWLRPGGKKTAISKDGRRKIHTQWEDGAELVEEFSLTTDEMIVRKHRRSTTLGGEGEWVFEIGEAPKPKELTFAEKAGANPVFIRKDTTDLFEWRIRNMPWPPSTYQLAIEGNEIVLRTTNKKYYKRWNIPELQVASLPIEPERLACKYENQTLIISYRKPQQVVKLDENARRERSTIRTQQAPSEEDCKQS